MMTDSEAYVEHRFTFYDSNGRAVAVGKVPIDPQYDLSMPEILLHVTREIEFVIKKQYPQAIRWAWDS